METNWTLIEYFTEDEMRCKCGCGLCCMDHDFMMILDWIRRNCGFPLLIKSGYRCHAHDKAIGGAGVHPMGVASDFGVYGKLADRVLELAYRKGSGITGKGIHQTGPYIGTIIHLDSMLLNSDIHPRPWLWTY